jgi:hypothetical protein
LQHTLTVCGNTPIAVVMDQLLIDVEAFLKAHPEVAPTRFGNDALGDRHFVRTLRAGRRVWPETEVKVRAFMNGFSTAPAEQVAA